MPHPGLIVRDECLTPHALSVTDAAKALGVDRQTLSNLLNGRSGISPEMALRLQKAFGVSARTWMEIQMEKQLAGVMERADEIKVLPFGEATRR